MRRTVFTIKVGINWQEHGDPGYYCVSALPLGGLSSTLFLFTKVFLKIIIIVKHLGL